MSIGQNNNRGKFIVFESNSVRLNNNIFPTQNINVSLNASLQDSLDINGDLIGYAPNGPVQGSASFSFDLTGALPSYFNITGLSEEPTLIKFNTFVMYGYLQNLKYNVRPYQPITVDADFAFFHGIKYLNSDRQDPVLANFDNTLKTYNGVRSYVLTDLSNNFTPLSFTYSLSAERVPYTKVGYESPTRVALENVRAEMVVEGNNLDDYLTIRGNDRRFVGVLNELYEYKPIDRISLIVDGKVVDQSFAIDSSSYGLSQLKLIQTLSKNRNIITIPFVDSETVFTSTTDRVYTLPDFAAVCPNIIRREQPVDGGGTPGDTPIPPDEPNGDDDQLTYTYFLIKIGFWAAGTLEGTKSASDYFKDENKQKNAQGIMVITDLGATPSTIPDEYVNWLKIKVSNNFDGAYSNFTRVPEPYNTDVSQSVAYREGNNVKLYIYKVPIGILSSSSSVGGSGTEESPYIINIDKEELS